MRPPEVAVAVFAAVVAVEALLAGAAAAAPFPAALRLQRALPPKGVPVEHLKERDRARHARRGLLGGAPAVAGVVDFPVDGSANPYMVGLYFTRVKLGNPPKEYFVQIDTGSDILWVACSPCNGCPTSSGLNIQLEFFNPDSSSTSSRISCSDDRCTAALQTGKQSAKPQTPPSSPCGYTFTYGDGSGTSGYYVSDTMYFNTVMGNEQTANSSASIVLGSDNGGGILVLGEIVEPGLVYTPLVPSQPHYNLNMESIAVNGQKIPIDSSLFTTSNTQGTIVDSGTTLAYLADGAYDPFVSAIAAAVSPSVRPIVNKGNQCFVTSSSVDSSFPTVTLYFMGGVAMTVKPENYLLQQASIENSVVWCIGWQRNQGQEITILGDLVLKDKIFVYDLANMRMGWADYDCSLSVNVTTSSGKNQYVNTGQFDVNGSLRRGAPSYSGLIPTGVAVLLVHMIVFGVVSRR